MALGHLAGRGRQTLYVSGEESAAQIRLRAERLEPAPRRALDVPVLAETDLDTVVATIAAERPDVCVVDSVQTLARGRPHRRGRDGRPGARGRDAGSWTSPSATAPRCSSSATSRRRARSPGPRVLEHLVDCVLQFEGERERTYRTLRALKNRFGSTNEVGVFEMRDGGLVEVLDASARFVGGGHARARQRRPRRDGGLAARCSSRCRRSSRRASSCRRGASSAGSTATASRSCSPCSARHAGVGTGTADVFVNVVGGVRVDEPGADLAVALAVAGAARGVVARRRGRPRARSPRSARSG